MHLLRILPVLLLLPVLALADSDKMFRVAEEQYKVGELFEPFTEMAIRIPGSVTTTAPTLPLKENALFLRHKKTPKEYYWVQGKVDPANYGRLHAFSLQKNHLTAFDVIRLRFYPTKNSKAFQDEKDIYFRCSAGCFGNVNILEKLSVKTFPSSAVNDSGNSVFTELTLGFRRIKEGFDNSYYDEDYEGEN